jgi:hypothetical protein
LDKEACWKVSNPGRDIEQFLIALAEMAPQDSVLYLEDGSPSRDLKAFLDRNRLPERSKIAGGTSWPWPLIFHLPVNKAFLLELARQTAKCATAEVCMHLHLYREGIYLIQGYDFVDLPIFISKEISQDAITKFCKRLGCTLEET